jgi:hypothetical protein
VSPQLPTEEKQAYRCNRQRRFASEAALTGCVFRTAGQIGMLRAYSLPVRPAVPFDRIEDRHGISCKDEERGRASIASKQAQQDRRNERKSAADPNHVKVPVQRDIIGL